MDIEQQEQEYMLLTKKLLQPFAAITFFYEAARITLDELDLHLTDWKDTKDRAASHGLYGTFRALARCSEIHTEHVVNGLFPEIKEFLNDQLRRRHLAEAEETKLNSALSAMPALAAEHVQNKAMSDTIKQHIARFVSKVEQNKENLSDDEETENLFQTVTEAVKPWMRSYQHWMIKEEQFLASWIGKLAQDKIDEIKLVRAIIDSNRDEILQHQFAFIVSKLSLAEDWTCPISAHQYTEHEVLAACIGALQVTSTDQEYQCFLDLIPKHIPLDVWQQLKQYGLHQKGTFRYSVQVARTSLAGTCVQNVSCSRMDSICSIL